MCACGSERMFVLCGLLLSRVDSRLRSHGLEHTRLRPQYDSGDVITTFLINTLYDVMSEWVSRMQYERSNRDCIYCTIDWWKTQRVVSIVFHIYEYTIFRFFSHSFSAVHWWCGLWIWQTWNWLGTHNIYIFTSNTNQYSAVSWVNCCHVGIVCAPVQFCTLWPSSIKNPFRSFGCVIHASLRVSFVCNGLATSPISLPKTRNIYRLTTIDDDDDGRNRKCTHLCA